MDITVENVSDNTNNVSQVTAQTSDPVQHLAIAQRFNITTPTKQEDKMLQEIWSFAAEKGQTNDISDIIWNVINLEGTIGAPRLGESRLDKLYRYVKLRRQEAQIQEELRNVATSSNLR